MSISSDNRNTIIKSKKIFFKIFKDKKKDRVEFVVAIVANIIFYYVANNLLSWDLSFITPQFSEVLPILNLFILITIGANILFLVYFRNWIRSLIQIGLNILGFMVIWTFYTVFPFSFSQIYISHALGFVFVVIMVIIIIVVVVEVIKFILNQILKVDLDS